MYPPFCPICGSKAHWSSDFSAEDFGYECEGIIGCYSCSNEKCNAQIEVRDFFINEDTEERSIKYYFFEYDEEDPESSYHDSDEIGVDVNYCLYCKNALETLEVKPFQEHEDDGAGVLTLKKCPHCDTDYDVEDIYPLEDIYRYPDDYLTIYDLRTIIVKD